MSTSPIPTFTTCGEIENHFRTFFEHEESTIAPNDSNNELVGGKEQNISESGNEADIESDEEEQDENETEDYFDNISDREDNRASDPFLEGTNVYSDKNLDIVVKSVAHKRRNRYEVNDHLYRVTFHKKRAEKTTVISLESAIEVSLIKIIDQLKKVYRRDNQHQIYVTIIEKRIKNGLNSGNYSLNTPSRVIARWVLSILYNYLKSKQTMKLNKSFQVMIKILSVRHMRELLKDKKRKKPFRPHMYH